MAADEHINNMVAAGLSVIPVGTDKKPKVKSWKEYSKRLPTEAEIRSMFGVNGNKKNVGVGVICGKVSGNVQCIDCDIYDGDALDTFLAICGDVIDLCYTQRTQSGGLHIVYRVPDDMKTVTGTLGSVRLTDCVMGQEYDVYGKKHMCWKSGDMTVSVFDGKGDGGYFVAAPTPGYEAVRQSPDILSLPVLDRKSCLQLTDACRIFCGESGIVGNNKKNTGDGPWEAYNRDHSCADILERNGWVVCGTDGDTVHYTRPGKEGRGEIGGSLLDGGRIFHVFTTNGGPLDADRNYDAYGLATAFGENVSDVLACGSVVENSWSGMSDADIVAEMNKRFAIVRMQSQVLIMETETGVFMKTDDFSKWFRNRWVWREGSRGHVKVRISDIWLDSTDRRQYGKVIFEPGIACGGGNGVGAGDGGTSYNLWSGFACEPVRGDWGKMKAHMQEVLCGGDKDAFAYLMYWCAAVVQHCAGIKSGDGSGGIVRRPEAAVVLKGLRGIGKDTFIELFAEIFGKHYAVVTQPEHLFGKFNASLQNCVLCHASEAFWAGDKKAEGQLKALITNQELFFEAKYRDNIKLTSHINLIISANEDWVVPVGELERRFFIPVTLQEVRGKDWFTAIRREWNSGGRSAMLYDLLRWGREASDGGNCGVTWTPPYRTSELGAQAAMSMTRIEKFWLECVSDPESLPWGERISARSLYDKYLTHCETVKATKNLETQMLFSKKIASAGNMTNKTIRFGGSVERGFTLPDIDEATENIRKRYGITL